LSQKQLALLSWLVISYKSLSEGWKKQCVKILMHSLSYLELTK